MCCTILAHFIHEEGALGQGIEEPVYGSLAELTWESRGCGFSLDSKPVVLNWGQFWPWGHLAISEDMFGCHSLDWGASNT
jgi:hypothetical protein